MSDDQVLADLGEDGLVAAVVARYGPLPPFVLVGPGDDAAVLDLRGLVVASTDTLVEGRDFLRAWSGGHDVGVKTAAQNFADIAAMGARPVALLVSLASPGDLPASFAGDLAAGLDEECRRAGAAVVGGDVSSADSVVVTGTALGVLDGPAVLRSGARAGDVVAVAGSTGRSAAGLALLSAGVEAGGVDVGDVDVAGGVFAGLLRAHLAPRPGYSAGPLAAAAGATALIDTSDGLLRDAARIAAASGVVLDLDLSALRPSAELRAAAERLGDPALAVDWVLSGGEDHALVACFPPSAALPDPYRVIGSVRARTSADTADVVVDSRPWPGVTGWLHWR